MINSYDLLPNPYDMIPEVQPADVFQKHPELLGWYKTYIGHTLEDIRSMHIIDSECPDRVPAKQTHVWVQFHSDHDVVGYRSFQCGPDGKLVPLEEP